MSLSSSETVESVALTITTFKRLDGITALLRSVGELVDLAPGWNLDHIVVVDNDPAGSAEETIRTEFPHVHYVCEPDPGIAAARNRAISEALALGAAWVTFVDDDQTVTPTWLFELTAEATRSGAEAIVGAVRFAHPPNTPDWFIGLGVFGDRLVDEEDMGGYFSTNNLLLRVSPYPVEPPLFDLRFGLTGGSDHHLGARMRASGRKISYAPKAFADETVLPERVNGKAAVKRILRYGNVLTRVDLAVAEEFNAPTLPIRARAVAEGVARFAFGGVRGILRSKDGVQGVTSGLRTSCIGLGQIYAAGGGTVEEYRRQAKKQ